jgi:hypothetical protein
VQLLLHEPAHLQHLRAHLLQVFVEAAGYVVREIGGFHVVYLEAKRRRRRARLLRLHPITSARQQVEGYL